MKKISDVVFVVFLVICAVAAIFGNNDDTQNNNNNNTSYWERAYQAESEKFASQMNEIRQSVQIGRGIKGSTGGDQPDTGSTSGPKPETTPDTTSASDNSQKICSACNGEKTCGACRGSGLTASKDLCSRCNANGKCYVCNGKGTTYNIFAKYDIFDVETSTSNGGYIIDDDDDDDYWTRPCLYCNGSGDCDSCYGDGRLEPLEGRVTGNRCPGCGGNGKCYACNGTGERRS